MSKHDDGDRIEEDDFIQDECGFSLTQGLPPNHTKLTPTPPRDDRGPRWLQAQVEALLAQHAIALAPPRFAGDVPCYWGTDLGAMMTLYLRLADDPEPKVLRFRRHMIEKCGAGHSFIQSQARLLIRRTFTKMGILHS